ncbi:MAG: DEAD/DEAH box helicase [Candidatus Paceibacterota bacterium]
MSKNLITLETKLSTVNFVAPKFLQKLKNLNIETVRDLLWHFPARYEDYATVRSIESLSVNDQATIKAEVKNTRLFKIQSRRLTVFEAIVNDGTSGMTLVWFNQPFIGKTVRIGTVANFAGKVTASRRGGLQMTNPKFEIPNQEDPTHTAGIIAVYPETKGLTSKGLRYLIKNFLQVLKIKEDFLPEKVLREQNLPTIDKALQYLHAPKNKTQIEKAQKRFSFEYLFLIQLTNLLTRSTLSKYKAPKLAVSKKKENEILKSLSFKLTKDQQNTLAEILTDIKKEKPMNRLVQGDVGSGKTIVAVVASLIAAENEHQSVFMAPTEVLAANTIKQCVNFSQILKKE